MKFTWKYDGHEKHKNHELNEVNMNVIVLDSFQLIRVEHSN